jgi:hypothetical protein
MAYMLEEFIRGNYPLCRFPTLGSEFRVYAAQDRLKPELRTLQTGCSRNCEHT